MKKKIFQAFYDLCIKIGTTNVSLSKIASELKMSKTNLYTYFPDKETLIFEFILYKQKEVFKKLENYINMDESGHAKIKLYLKGHISLILNNEPFFRIIGDILTNQLIKDEKKISELMEIKVKINSFLFNILKETVDKGLIRNDIDIDIMRKFVTGIIHVFLFEKKFSTEKCIFSIEEVDKYVEQIYDIVINGIKKPL